MPGKVTCSFIEHPSWQSQPVVNAIVPNQTVIWYGSTKALMPGYNNAYALLCDAEKIRAASFYQEIDRQRYVIQHGVLRHLLARYLHVAASDMQFDFNPYQKPYLAGQTNGQFHFNLSRTGGDFLIAIGEAELGIDIEQAKPGFNYNDIVSRYFGIDEIDFIYNWHNAIEAFFLLWTRKEALLKACGMGIDDNLPAVPALDGVHTLPGYYPAKEYVTQSFCINNGLIGSVTSISAQNMSFVKIDAGLLGV